MNRQVAAAGLALALWTPVGAWAKESADPVNRIFLVGGSADWVDTRLDVRPQDRLTIRTGAELCFSGGSGESCVRPVGWPRQTYAERWPEDAAACEDPFPEWDHATVIARVGDEVVLVGKQTVVEGKEGRVRLAVNDCSFEGDHGNEGSFSVVLVVENPTAHAARGGRELIESAIDAMGGKAIQGIKGLRVRAACTGPGGAFTTEVLSLLPDQTLFRQSSDAGSAEWVAIGEQAWRIDRERGTRKADKKMSPVIHGHEFHYLLFELDTRFRNHTVPRTEAAEAEGSADPAATAESKCVRVEMEDLYGAPAAVCLDPMTSLPVHLSVQPAGKKKEPTIEIELENWLEIDGVRYLQAFTLRQGDDVFAYSYEEILPNAVDRSVFKAVSPRALAEIRKKAKRQDSETPPEASGSPEAPEEPTSEEGVAPPTDS